MVLYPGAPLHVFTFNIIADFISFTDPFIIQFERNKTDDQPNGGDGNGNPVKTDPCGFHGCEFISFGQQPDTEHGGNEHGQWGG